MDLHKRKKKKREKYRNKEHGELSKRRRGKVKKKCTKGWKYFKNTWHYAGVKINKIFLPENV